MSGGFPENAFWDWSLAVYGLPGVAPACLDLQDRHGLDVNLVLFCCWAASRGHHFDREAFARAAAEVEAWHREVVRPLRALRKRLKGGLPPVPATFAESVRGRIASTELDAEHVEQIVLSRYAPAEVPAPSVEKLRVAAGHLSLLAKVSGFTWSVDDLSALRSLLAGAFPEADTESVSDLAAAIVAGSAA